MLDLIPPELPKHLFKYRSVGGANLELERLREIIIDGEIYWPSPVEFNDPFDCLPAFSFPRGKKLRDLSTRLHREQNPNASRFDRRKFRRNIVQRGHLALENGLSQQINLLMEATSVYSLARAADNILMWSHYANSHKGVCLRFDLVKLAAAYLVMAPVRYSVERPVVLVGEEDAEPLMEKMLLTKSEQWRYEQEWRIVGYRQPRGKRKLPTECLTGIVLGSKMETEDRNAVIEMAEKVPHSIAIYAAVRDARLFAINLEPLNVEAVRECRIKE